MINIWRRPKDGWQKISRNVQNTKISDMHNLLSQGHDMDYIARHYHMNLALAWALRLEGKTDQEKFKEHGWGLRTWDQWYFCPGASILDFRDMIPYDINNYL